MDKFLAIAGVKLAVAAAGIKAQLNDVCLIKAEQGSAIAGVFTQNKFCAAPVHLCRQNLLNVYNDTPIYLLINSGNANAGTGYQGMQNAISCCQQLAEQASVSESQIFPFSTGVIGEPLPVDKIIAQYPKLLTKLSDNNWSQAAQAIMTTDTCKKISARQINLQNGEKASIQGICKGSGMIHPDMATMLAFVATDLQIEQNTLQKLLHEAVDCSFNRISVDGDTSTNDACMLIASAKGANYAELDKKDQLNIKQALKEVFIELAKAIIQDGEGATKLIEIQVINGVSQEDCLSVARTVATSPLVKTAFFASDANWGRILAAVGRAKVEQLDVDEVNIYLDDVCIVEKGGRAQNYQEQQGAKVMSQKEITVTIDLASGNHQETFWSCDFSYDYVKINAEYRT